VTFLSQTEGLSAAINAQASPSLKRALELASKWGASNWLTVLSVQEHGFTLHKTAFHDAILSSMVGILLDFQLIALVG